VYFPTILTPSRSKQSKVKIVDKQWRSCALIQNKRCAKTFKVFKAFKAFKVFNRKYTFFAKKE